MSEVRRDVAQHAQSSGFNPRCCLKLDGTELGKSEARLGIWSQPGLHKALSQTTTNTYQR